ncbi:MAG: EamA family transporter [Acidobacteria bacterium]|nr:EamA family transporter [Acidobacteriota bacterium]
MGALLAAVSALSFGVGDFLGGLSARRMPAVLAALTAQVAGLVLLVGLALVAGGDAAGADLAVGAAAGVSGAAGLVLFYWALAEGKMSVVAPLSAVMSALVPMGFGLLTGERPSTVALLGALVALPAIALIAREPGDEVGDGELSPEPAGHRRRWVLAAATAAGVGFGGFFVLLSRSADGSGMWPLVSARTTAAVVVAVTAIALRPGRFTASGLRAAMFGGCFDVAANALFLVATREGLLALVGVIGAMYPASTVVLARLVLNERLARHQLWGLALAAGAVAAIAAG